MSLLTGLDLLKTAIEKAGYTGKIKIGMDVAASEFCKDKKYDLDFKNPDSKPADYVGIGGTAPIGVTEPSLWAVDCLWSGHSGL